MWTMIRRHELKAAWSRLLFTQSLLHHQHSQHATTSAGKVTPTNQHSLSSSEMEVEGKRKLCFFWHMVKVDSLAVVQPKSVWYDSFSRPAGAVWRHLLLHISGGTSWQSFKFEKWMITAFVRKVKGGGICFLLSWITDTQSPTPSIQKHTSRKL